MKSVAKKTHQGFTLLELLVSLTLFSVISVGLYSGLNIAIKSLATGEQHAQELKRVMAIQSFLRTRLASVKKEKSQKNQGKLQFTGQENEIEFISSMPLSIDQGGDALYKISMLKKGRESILNVLLEPYPKEKSESVQSSFDKPVEVADIKQLTIHYFGKKLGEQAKNWHTQWVKQKRLPSLIKIKLVSQSGVAWPPIVIAPKAATSQKLKK